MQDINEFNQILGPAMNDWQPKQPPANKILSGRFCRLEPINIEKHANQLFQSLLLNNNGESWTYLPYGPFDSMHEFSQWLQNTIEQKDVKLYAIVDNTSNIPVGISGYLRINPEHGSIEVGHLHFSSLLKRTPAATEAMYLMMRYAFDELQYRRYEWKCNALNEPSKMAALRLGFQFEGIFRQSNVFKNRNRDTAWYSIIDSEWPAIRNRFESWLHPDNFDEQGKQVKSLKNS